MKHAFTVTDFVDKDSFFEYLKGRLVCRKFYRLPADRERHGQRRI